MAKKTRKNLHKKKILVSAISIFSVSLITIPTVLESQNNNLTLVSKEQQAIGNVTESEISSFAIKTKDQLGDEWWNANWGTYTADTIPNDVIKAVLTPNIDASYYIQKNTQSSDAISQGYVTFYVVQKITTYDNGKPTTSTEKKLTPFANWSAGDANDTVLWSTKNQTSLNGLVKAQKYSFSWNTDENISAFLKTNTKKVSELKNEANISDLIKTNFVSTSSSLPEGTTFSIDVPTGITNADKYGVGEITITFPANSNTPSGWENNTYPGGTNNKVTRIFRGFGADNGSSSEVSIIKKNYGDIVNATISATALKNLGLENYVINPSNTTLHDLLPSQISTLDKTQLKQLFLNEGKVNYLTYPNNANGTPAVTMSYMGKYYTDSDFGTSTGLNNVYMNGQSKDVSSNVMISDIEVNPNDFDGSMVLSFTYSTYDVYTNTILENQKDMIAFEAGAFRTNPDAGKDLTFNFLSESEISSMYTKESLLKAYNDNQNDQVYLKALSNSLIFGSSLATSKDRTLKIEEVNGATDKLKITITYDGYQGSVYTNSAGQKVYGLQQSAEITFSNATALNVSWKTQTQVESSVDGWADYTASEIANLLANKSSTKASNINLSMFLDNPNNYQVLVIADDMNGTLSIQAFNADGTQSAMQFFTGLSTDATGSEITSFSFISSNEISTELLSKSVDDITVQDIIDGYLSKIPYFQNTVINPNNVKIAKTGNGSISVTVTLDEWNQSSSSQSITKQFTTSLSGFADTSVKDKNSYVAPLDLTVILSATLAVVISVSLIALLAYTIIKRMKINKFTKKKFDK